MTTSRSLERRGAFTLACMAVLIVVAEPTRDAAMLRSPRAGGGSNSKRSYRPRRPPAVSIGG
jgi:hypothetical protein